MSTKEFLHFYGQFCVFTLHLDKCDFLCLQPKTYSTLLRGLGLGLGLGGGLGGGKLLYIVRTLSVYSSKYTLTSAPPCTMVHTGST